MTNDDEEEGQSEYKGLRSARGALRGMAGLLYVIAGFFILVSLLIGVRSMSASPSPLGSSPFMLVPAVALFVLAVVCAIVGWNVSLASERLEMEIETIARIRHLLHETIKAREDQQSLSGKFELQLRSISASSARTAEAVEALVNSVRRPPPAA